MNWFMVMCVLLYILIGHAISSLYNDRGMKIFVQVLWPFHILHFILYSVVVFVYGLVTMLLNIMLSPLMKALSKMRGKNNE